LKWRHAVYLTIPEKDLLPIDMKNSNNSGWNQYYKWAPFGYIIMPNNGVLVGR
jgi:hypothetical protein